MLLWGRRNEELPHAAYRLQWEIVTNPGHGAWTNAWSRSDGRHTWAGESALHVIVGPVLSRVDQLDRAVLVVLKLEPTQDLAKVLHQTHDVLQPLLPLRVAWRALLESRVDDSASEEDGKQRVEMNLDFGGFNLAAWEHEEEAVGQVLVLMPLLDRLHQALIPHSGTDLTARTGL